MKLSAPWSAKQWWGRDGISHHFVDIYAEESACGRPFEIASTKKPWTRLSTETGEPWPHCKQCERALLAPGKEQP